MKSKHWFFVVAALILMIVVAPWYMKAQSLTAQETAVGTNNASATTLELTNDLESSGLQVGIIKDRTWHAGDLMLVSWKINSVSYSPSDKLYFEVTGKDSTKDVVLPLDSKSIELMPNPFVWSVPKDIVPSEYILSSYVYGTSSDPIIVGKDVEFTIESSSSSNAVSDTKDTSVTPPEANNLNTEQPVVKSNDDHSSTSESNISGDSSLSSLERRMLELEKMMYLLRVQIEELTGKAIQPQSEDKPVVVEPVAPTVDTGVSSTTPSLTSDHADIEKLPVAWSESYLNMKDTDGDGLPDKIETLIGTKIDNPDSDGDGYSDGLEIKSGFDPLTVNKTEIKSTKIDSLEGKTISTTNADGQVENWLVKDGRKVYLGEASS